MAVADEVVVRMRVDDAQYNAALSRDQANFDKLISKIEADARNAGVALSQIGRGAQAGFAGVVRDAPRASTAIRGAGVAAGQARLQMQNLSFQTQDVVQQMIAGQSPLGILSQQLFQITQYGGSLTGIMGALGATLRGLFSPLGLLTTAFVLGGSAAISYFRDVMDGGEESEETLKKQEQLIARIAERWGDAAPALKAYADQIRRANELAETEAGRDIIAEKNYDPVRKAIEDTDTELKKLMATSSQYEKIELEGVIQEYNRLQEKVADNSATAADAMSLQQKLAATMSGMGKTATETLTAAMAALVSEIREASKATEELDKQILGFQQGGTGGPRRRGTWLDLPNEVDAPSPFGVDDASIIRNGPGPNDFTRIGQSMDDAAEAIDGFVQRVIKAESGGRTDAKNPNSTATGTGQFIESTWLDLFRRHYPAQAANMGRDAILELRKNADVSYALIQKYAEENARVLQRAGVHVDEAALQLAHFLGAGDAAKVLAAASGTPLQGLISQASINANPTILGGGRTVDDARAYANRRANAPVGDGVGSTKKTPEQLFEGSVEQVQKRIDMLNAELEATKGLTAGTDEYALAVEKARIEAQLLADAKSHDLTITPELAAQISTLAENYAKASVGARGLRDANKDLAKSQEEMANFGKDVLGGFISDLREGKSGAEALANALEKVADKLLQIALDALFSTSGGGGFGSILSAIFGGIGKRERGGPVTAGRPYIVGEKRPELFVPSQSGSIIPQVPTAAAVGGRGGGSVEIMVKSVRGEMFDTIVDTRAQGVSMKVSRSTIAAYDKQLTNTFGPRMRMAQDKQN